MGENKAGKYFRAKEAAAYLRIGLSTFYRRVQAGAIPPGIRQSVHCVLWTRDSLDAFMASCAGEPSMEVKA